MHQVYPRILTDANIGKSLNKAIQDKGVPQTSLFKNRYPEELKIVDATQYEHLWQQCSGSSSKLAEECWTCITDEDSPHLSVIVTFI